MTSTQRTPFAQRQTVNPRHQVEDIYALSPLQSGLLFHSLYEPESGVYVEQLHCILEGELDVQAFRAAWQAVLTERSVLRTAFVWESLQEPLQIAQRKVELPFQFLDWRQVPTEEQELRWRDFVAEDRRKSFELHKAPLLRVALVAREERSHYFLWSHHHILLDGWSQSLVLADVFEAYENIKQGKAISLPRRRPYRDYIAWLQKLDKKAAEDYWRRTMFGFEATTSLGISHPKVDVSDVVSDYGVRTLNLSATRTAALKSLVKTHRLTLNTVIQGAWGLLLSRYSSRWDVMFGVTVSGRPVDLVGAESMVGLFINTLPLRVGISPDVSAMEWLTALLEQNLEMRRYEHTPLVDIHGWSNIPRGQLLFESLLVFENYPVDKTVSQNAGKLEVREVHSVEQTNYPLTLIAGPGEELTLRLMYDHSLFDDEAVSRLMGHLDVILDGLAQHPEASVGKLPLLTETERHQLIMEWNATEAEFPREQCIHQLLEAQVERTPEAVAVVYEDQQLTYAQLNAQANQLAHYLQNLRVGPDVLVALCVERPLEMIVSILGVLKTGGAYVPIDPRYPEIRIAHILANCRPELLLTDRSLTLHSCEHTRLIDLKAEWKIIAAQSDQNISGTHTAQNLAYIIYTSGSTGMPKGVAMPHIGLVNLLTWQRRCLSTKAKTLQLTTPSFDVSFQEIFSTLSQGGVLILCDEELRRDFERLAALIESQEIERLFLPFVALQNLAAFLSGKIPASLREVITAGEQLRVTKEILSLFQNAACSLHNHYGPTESHVVTAFTLPQIESQWPKFPPIGRPIANTQVYLLDRYMEPTPLDVPGELYIGGVSLARGYVDRPDLTAERFVPDPFTGNPGQRLYRTGDLARFRADGCIEFLGRIDHQVKIRGFRIELGEIEARLREHPDVKEAVVAAREDVPGDKRLVAYLVGNDEAPVNPDRLRAHLQAVLPDYMVPTAFVTLDALPLTASGKLDRKHLPAPDIGAQSTRQYIAPRDPTEQILVGIWTEVLGVERVGILDNFFELGGHSLTATQVVTRIRTTFDIDLPIRSLFTQPTIEQLASEVAERIFREIESLTEADAERAIAQIKI